jgi:hypothetical protein
MGRTIARRWGPDVLTRIKARGQSALGSKTPKQLCSFPFRGSGGPSSHQVRLGSVNNSQVFLTTPKVAASAVGCQSVTVEWHLDTVEVRSSSLLVPTIYLIESAHSRAAVLLRVWPTRHHWSPNPKDFRLPSRCAVESRLCKFREWLTSSNDPTVLALL